MGNTFQRLFMMSEPEVLPLNEQAARGAVREPERSQFTHLVRHFLERFFNHETASPEGDAKSRMVLIACAAGLPPFMVAIYLWPIYHPFIGWPPGTKLAAGPPPYWVQVNHHFFFVVYAFVSIGIAVVYQWDLFFPDLLDIFVLGPLPIPDRRIFLSRVAAIGIFIGGFLFDANFLAPLALPSAIDPPNIARFYLAHLPAVVLSALFAAAFILAMQSLVLAVFGERLFRRFSLAAQGCAIAALLLLLLLFPVFSGVVPALLRSGSAIPYYIPPFWFLGIYQRMLDGPAALPVYAHLAGTGCAATLIALVLAVLAYPFAYLRRVKQLVEGSGAQRTRNLMALPLDGLLHHTLVRPPVRRAVFHFIGQTILRVPRYRIYLVLYGGVGASIVAATILRFTVAHSQVHVGISADGLRAAAGIISFWTIAGLRMAFVSAGNRRGSWVFRIVHGRPAPFAAAIEQLSAAKIWVLIAACAVTFAALAAFHRIAPQELLQWPAVAAQWLVAAGLCLVLTDVFFLNVTETAFTGEPTRSQSSLAFTVMRYYFFFPPVSVFPIVIEPWIAKGVRQFAIAAAMFALAHLALRARFRQVVKENSNAYALEDDEEDFPMKLGLRY
jgi:hypothetical protein